MILKRQSFIRETGLTSVEAYENYLMEAVPAAASERIEMNESDAISVYTYRKNKKENYEKDK